MCCGVVEAMANKHRGEVDAVLNGRRYTLCLTLGALAELETAFGDDNMLALAERFETGRLSARDAIRIIGAGLRGAGHTISDETVASMSTEGGAAGHVALIAALLTATFGGDSDATAAHGESHVTNPAPEEGRVEAVPFPGKT